MPLAAVGLIVLSALTHAVWNALLKRAPSPQQASVGVTIYSGLTALLAALVARSPTPLPVAALAWGLTAGLVESAYFYVLGLALEAAPLSVAYPVIRGAAVVMVWPMSMAVTHEAVDPMTMAGAALVVGGLWLAAGRPRTGGAGRTLWPALAAALCIALDHVAYRQGIVCQGRPTTIFGISMTVAMAISLLRTRLQPQTVDRAVLRSPRVMLVGVLASLSFLLALWAMQSTGAGRVLTLRNLSIPCTVLLGMLAGERPTRSQLLGALVVTGGAFLITL